jgi:serine/threonine protein kinase
MADQSRRILGHAHERGILHHDLKPANVLLSDDGQPMLLDFNLAVDVQHSGPGDVALRRHVALTPMVPTLFLSRGRLWVVATHSNSKYSFADFVLWRSDPSMRRS